MPTILRICPGKRHAWYSSEHGPVRKPLNVISEVKPVDVKIFAPAGKEITTAVNRAARATYRRPSVLLTTALAAAMVSPRE